jgi:hypothetical protein
MRLVSNRFSATCRARRDASPETPRTLVRFRAGREIWRLDAETDQALTRDQRAGHENDECTQDRLAPDKVE